jgi:hypothetical protein
MQKWAKIKSEGMSKFWYAMQGKISPSERSEGGNIVFGPMYTPGTDS